jgi:hypothetical protein
VLLGLAMLVGWWAVFWVLAFFTLVTQSVAAPLALLAWLLVPPLTSLPLWLASGSTKHRS